MKVSGLILTALALTYLYLWRSNSLGLLTPAPAVGTLVDPYAKAGRVAP